jgi:hypothetical protein
MPSPVSTAFHDAVARHLTDDRDMMLDSARGGGPESRELERTCLLARFAIDWAAVAVAKSREGSNGFDQLRADSPECGGAIEAAAMAEARNPTNDPATQDICLAAASLGGTLKSVDEVAPLSRNSPAFRCVSEDAATILVALGALRDDPDWICVEANKVLLRLVNPSG